MIVEMRKVQIAGLRSHRQELISLLHNLGVLHIEFRPLSKLLQQGGLVHLSLEEKEERERAIIEEALKKIRDISSRLKAPCSEDIGLLYRQLEGAPLSDIQGRANEIGEKMRGILEEGDKQKAVDRKKIIEGQDLSFLHAARLLLHDRLDELLLQPNCLASKYTFTVTGWLPKEKFAQTKEALEREFANKIIIQDITKSVKGREEVPILLKNPKAVAPFELLLSFLQPPKYGTFDPTKLMAIFFPLFFGLIVGDIGYGLVLLIISRLLRRARKPLFAPISALVAYASVSSIIFGTLFAEFFGELGSKILGLHPILFHRQEAIVPFLILSISLGLFHILLGLVLGVIEAARQRHRKALWEKGSLIFSLFGLFLLVGASSELLPRGFFVPSVGILTVCLVVLIWAKGFIGPLEAVSCVANILSYARIMALGLAGVVMAHIANTFGGLIGNVILGVIVASLVHILNLALSVFSPTVQSLRLHYVEFFSKFYEPGGKRYRPFKKGGEILCRP